MSCQLLDFFAPKVATSIFISKHSCYMKENHNSGTSSESCQCIYMLLYLGVKLLEFGTHNAAADKRSSGSSKLFR